MKQRHLLTNLLALATVMLLSCSGVDPLTGFDLGDGSTPDVQDEIMGDDTGTCVPDCTDKVCGDDGCEGSCGDCDEGIECIEGTCQPAEPFCGDETCDKDEDCLSCADDCGECPGECPDETCDPGEDCETCPEDCGECSGICGDETCDEGENCESCSDDCGECCGNETCEADFDEDCNTCPSDCGECCGNEECEADLDEDCQTCPGDCGKCCGNETCEAGHDETCDTCPLDCGSCCGNESCEAALGEDCNTCPADCGQCCGNQLCDEGFGESCGTCPADCGQCCGNQVCDYGLGETCLGCPADCGECPVDCGDAVCQGDETCANCPNDCGECCGDSVCQGVYGEDCENCSQDCGDCPPACGNGECGADESCANCPEDCDVCCGNGVCQAILEESCTTCPEDCGECPAECGDETCDDDEDCGSCPEDCGKCCGNEECEVAFGEDCETCPEDCDECPAFCGDLICDDNEDCLFCPADCGLCCGDGECLEGHDEACDTCPKDCGQCCGDEDCDADKGETCGTCPADCGKCPPVCNDGICEPPETCGDCPSDCGCPGTLVCFEAVCCQPMCEGKDCSSDGCGGDCGVCDDGAFCDDTGICQSEAGQACKDIFECVVGCSMDLACSMECQNQGTLEAQEAFQELASCLMGNCGFMVVDEECWLKTIGGECLPEYTSCTLGFCEPQCEGKECGSDGCGGSCGECPDGTLCGKDGICEEQEELACDDIMDCVLACSENPGCALNCQAMGSEEGQATFAELAQCLMAECGFLGFDEECWMKAAMGPCLPLYQACQIGSCEPDCDGKECGKDGCGGLCGVCKPGMLCTGDGQCLEPAELSCPEILDCVMGCGMDPGCILECQAEGTPEAQELFQGLMACAMGACGIGMDPECIMKAIGGKCAAQFEICMNGPCVTDCDGKECGDDGCGGICGKCDPGTFCADNGMCVEVPQELSCDEIVDCVFDCALDPGCIIKCQNQGSPEAQFLFEELTNCLMDQCGFMIPDLECWEKALSGECSQEYLVCQDGGCEPKCEDKNCGPDGCGGICGQCKPGMVCGEEGVCQVDLGLDCEGILNCVMACGFDQGCALDCQAQGTVEAKEKFQELSLCLIVVCGTLSPEPLCLAKAVAGECKPQYDMCLDGPCVPDCGGKECGKDGCGGICGICELGQVCGADGLCVLVEEWTCMEIMECVQGCGVDMECILNCQEHGSPEANALFEDLSQCLMTVCGLGIPDPLCWFKALEGECAKPYEACQGGICEPDCDGKECGKDGCGGSCGTCDLGEDCNEEFICEDALALTCEEVLECVMACGLADPGCYVQCQKAASPEALELYQELSVCVQEICGGIIPSPECLEDAISGPCAAKHKFCVEGECVPQCAGKECGDDDCGESCGWCQLGLTCDTNGMCVEDVGLSCSEIIDCAVLCGNDPGCVLDCQTQGSQQAQELAQELLECVMAMCGFPFDMGCIFLASQGECMMQYDQCMLGPCEPDCEDKECGKDGCGGSCGNCGLGQFCDDSGMCGQIAPGVDCEEILTCVMGCGQNIECFNKCQSEGTPEAQEKAQKLMMCLMQACPTLDQACMLQAAKGECKDQYDVCVGGGCEPDCTEKECGKDGCGGSCGDCEQGFECTADGLCLEMEGVSCIEVLGCVLDCAPDLGCMDECQDLGTPEAQEQAQALLMCVFSLCPTMDKDCMEKVSMGGGQCEELYYLCLYGGPCEPDCEGKNCGNDGCGGSCGMCDIGMKCGKNGICMPNCQPQCKDKECGPDGCDGSCGECKDGLECNDAGQCGGPPPGNSCAEILTCVLLCGNNIGCLNDCQAQGTPEAQEKAQKLMACLLATCPTMDQNCMLKAAVAECKEPYDECQAGECIPNCDNKMCGDDGCGESCGKCDFGLYCSEDGQCTPEQVKKNCGEIATCAMLCGADIACTNACAEGGSEQATLLWNELSKCLFTQCMMAPTPDCFAEAAMGACSAQYQACMKDD
jgi:hypothetical protein